MPNLDELIEAASPSNLHSTAINRRNILISRGSSSPSETRIVRPSGREILIRTIYVIGTLSLISSLVIYLYYSKKEDAEQVIEIKNADINITNNKIVDISGSVVKPGVYTLGAASRVADALTVSRGFLGNVDTEWVEKNLNLASLINDGQKIYIPSKGEISVSDTPTTQSKVNLNLATVSELDAIPGVSAALAQKIIDYRLAHGQFTSTDELTNVSGIGDATLNKIKPYVLVP